MPDILLVFLVFAFILFPLFLIFGSFYYSRLIIRSHRQSITEYPKEYGMNYEDIEFKSSDGLKIKGWFIPGSSPAAIVISHPWTFNRYGFDPKKQGLIKLFRIKVDMLLTARALNQAGYSILMFDFRNHGESQDGVTTVGVKESLDAEGAVNYLKSRSDIDPGRLGLVGFCMGANAFLALAGRLPGLRCLIAIQPVSLAISTKRYLERIIGSRLALVVIWLTGKMCQWQGGCSIFDMSPLKFAAKVKIPTLFIQAESDPWGTVEDVKSFYSAVQGPKYFWLIRGNLQRFDTYNYVGQHPERLIEFLNQFNPI